jgi:hypothetical protein
MENSSTEVGDIADLAEILADTSRRLEAAVMALQRMRDRLRIALIGGVFALYMAGLAVFMLLKNAQLSTSSRTIWIAVAAVMTLAVVALGYYIFARRSIRLARDHEVYSIAKRLERATRSGSQYYEHVLSALTPIQRMRLDLTLAEAEASLGLARTVLGGGSFDNASGSRTTRAEPLG